MAIANGIAAEPTLPDTSALPSMQTLPGTGDDPPAVKFHVFVPAVYHQPRYLLPALVAGVPTAMPLRYTVPVDVSQSSTSVMFVVALVPAAPQNCGEVIVGMDT